MNSSWAIIPLRSVAGETGLITDGDWIVSKNMDPTGEIRLIQLADVGVGRFLNRSSKFINHQKFKELQCTALKANDVLISRMADPIGRACLVPELPCKAITVVDITIVRTDLSIADPHYIVYYCNTSQFLAKAKAAATGTTRSRITRRNLEKMRTPLPPFSEQRRIVQILDQADALRKKRAEADKKAKKILSALFYKMFGDPISNPLNWDTRKLEQVAATSSGGTPDRKNSSYFGGGIPWVKSGELSQPILVQTEETLTEEGLINSAAKWQEAGSILVALYGATVGAVSLLGIRATTNQAVCSISVSHEISNIFLADLLRLLKPQLLRKRVGGAQPNISQRILRNIILPIPPRELQHKYESISKDMLNMNSYAQKVGEKLENLFMTLQYCAFSGDLTAEWREAHMKELLTEMEEQAKVIKQRIV